MQRHICCFIALVGCLILSSCSINSSDHAFTSGREAFYSNVHRVALAPVGYVGMPVASEELSRQMRSDIKNKMEASGFEVILFDPAQAQGQYILRDAEKFYNPDNLVLKIETLRDEVYQFHKASMVDYDADAFVFPVITAVKAHWEKGIVDWDGAKESITSQDECPFCMAALQDYKGTIDASSIRLIMMDKDKKTYYEKSGGIELLSRYLSDGAFKADFEKKAPTELFQDRDRQEKAVEIALRPLAQSE